MFDFLKKFKKECVNTSEQLENTEEKIEEPVKQEKPIIAIIDGLLYDTSKATKILEYYDVIGCGTYWINKTLYITNSKRFFYTDNWGTKGNGTITLKDNQIELKLETTSAAQGALWGVEGIYTFSYHRLDR